MVAIKPQQYEVPPITSIVEFTYDPSRRPNALSKMMGIFLSSLSSSFGLGETVEKAEAADPQESVPSTGVAGAVPNNIFDPTSIVSSSATPTTVLSFLPPSTIQSPPQAHGAMAAPSAPPVFARSDSDVARELDKELNGV